MSIKNNIEIDHLEFLLKNSKNPVIITGAGVSTLSGIPDYSSMPGFMTNDSLYISPRQILSSGFCYGNHADFVEWFLNTFYIESKPNKIHNWIEKMSNEINNLNVITQNVDGLQIANNLIEFHGNAHVWFCEKCKLIVPKNIANTCSYRCEKCNHILQPNITLYGQFVKSDILHKTEKICREADVIIILGTSLDVHPLNEIILNSNNNNKKIIYWLDKRKPRKYNDYADSINLVLTNLNNLISI